MISTYTEYYRVIECKNRGSESHEETCHGIIGHEGEYCKTDDEIIKTALYYGWIFVERDWYCPECKKEQPHE